MIVLDITYKGMRIEPTLSASRELMNEGKDLYDVLKILEEGYDCSASKRDKNITERCWKKVYRKSIKVNPFWEKHI